MILQYSVHQYISVYDIFNHINQNPIIIFVKIIDIKLCRYEKSMICHLKNIVM